VKLPPFEYLKASTLEEAVSVLAADEDAHVLAGGQSLIPLLALRLARPSVLVDITGLGFDGVGVFDGADAGTAAGAGASGGADPGGERLALGALVRQRRIELDPAIGAACPLLADAVRHVGYPATRNLGTLGGCLAHADPASELAAAAVALGGEVLASGPAGERRLSCVELADGYFTTTLERGEILTQVELPVAGARHGAAWCEWAPRSHDFALAGVGVALELDGGGACARVAAAACSIGGAPLELGAVLAEAGLLGASSVPPALVAAVASSVEAAAGEVLAGGTSDERAELAGLLAGRASLLAFERASTAALARVS